MMKFALYLPNFGPYGNARMLSDLAVDAEQAGWDGIFLWDHIVRYWPADVADAWISLSAIAVRTQHLRLGALITPLARRRPWKVAREAITLDRLSNGRLILGAGLGSSGGSRWNGKTSAKRWTSRNAPVCWTKGWRS
jgi:alkanesulfonate monooxygenase SsuD/methylene tetrahydromethanopterin reductase-like flavin-dependent oxidoreductase (luciferase family)